MRKLVVAGFLLILAGFSLYGQTTVQQPFVVQYVDGSVQVQLKGQTAWKTLKAKDRGPGGRHRQARQGCHDRDVARQDWCFP